MTEILRRIYINNEMDVALARLQAREVAKALGFGTVDQARISLATSELVRNVTGAEPSCGEVRVSRLQRGARKGLQVEYLRGESGPVDEIKLSDLVGASHLMDECSVHNDPEDGPRVTLIKWQQA